MSIIIIIITLHLSRLSLVNSVNLVLHHCHRCLFTLGMTLRKNLQLAVLEILEGVLGLVTSLAQLDPGCVLSLSSV